MTPKNKSVYDLNTFYITLKIELETTWRSSLLDECKCIVDKNNILLFLRGLELKSTQLELFPAVFSLLPWMAYMSFAG